MGPGVVTQVGQTREGGEFLERVRAAAEKKKKAKITGDAGSDEVGS